MYTMIFLMNANGDSPKFYLIILHRERFVKFHKTSPVEFLSFFDTTLSPTSPTTTQTDDMNTLIMIYL